MAATVARAVRHYNCTLEDHRHEARASASNDSDLTSSLAINFTIVLVSVFLWRIMKCLGLALGESPRRSALNPSGNLKSAVAYNYITFLRYCRNLFIVMTLITAGVRYPRNGFEPFTSVFVESDSVTTTSGVDNMALAYMCIDTILRGLVALLFIEWFQKQVQRPFHKVAEENVIQRTLWLSGIPAYDYEKRQYFKLPDEDFKRVSKDLKEAITSDVNEKLIGLSKQVKMHVELVPVVEKLGDVSLRLRNAEESLFAYYALLNSHHKTIWQRCMSRWYAWKHARLELQVSQLQHKKAELQKNKKRLAGSAFITFKEKSHCDHFLRAKPHCLQCRAHAHFTFGKPPFTSVTLQCSRAPHPTDVNWVNLHISLTEQVLRFAALTILLFVGMVVLVTPVTISSQIDVILPALREHVEDVAEVFRGRDVREEAVFWTAVSKQLPALILVVINSIFLPTMISSISETVRTMRKSTMEVIQLHLNYVFLILNAMVIPFFGLSSTSALIEFGRHCVSMKLLPRIGEKLMSSTGIFVVRYILNCACVTNANSLLQPVQLVASAYSRWSARTARECVEAEERWPFAWGYWYAWVLSIYTMGILMSVPIPSTLPCAAFFFTMQLAVDRYNLTYGVYSLGVQSEGLFITRALHYMRCCIGVWWFFMGCIYIVLRQQIGDSPSWVSAYFFVEAISAVMIVSAFFICLCSWCNQQLILHDSQFQIVDVAERGFFGSCCRRLVRRCSNHDYSNLDGDGDESDFNDWSHVQGVEMHPLTRRYDSIAQHHDALQWDARSAVVHETSAF